MPTIVEFSIPSEEFALHETLERRPDLTFEINRVVAHDTTQVVPFVRVTYGEFEGLTEILENDSSVEEVEMLGETNDERFYRLVWGDGVSVISYMVNEQDATVQEATATSGEWHLRVLFPERSGLSATSEYAQEVGTTFHVTRIYGIDELEEARYNLTEEQHDTLIKGVEQGYYDIPREVNAKDLADEFGISHQALSERFRRATKNLVKSTLSTSQGSPVDAF